MGFVLNTTDYIGNENIVYSRTIFLSNLDMQREQNAIENLYDKYMTDGTQSKVNMLYKPHPRQSLDWLDNLKDNFDDEYPNHTGWYHVVEPTVPI